MGKYLVKRLLMVIPVVIGVSLITFLMMHLTPADPALLMLGERATEEELYTLRKEMGLLEPLPTQYARYITKALQGDLGRSIKSNRPVAKELSDRMPATIKLAVASMAVAAGIGVTVGVLSATRPNSVIDNASTTLALVGVATPNFWMGLMFQIVFAVTLGWLPASGAGTWKHLILPAITLGSGSAAIILRMTRSAMLEVVRNDYIRTARAKGLSERIVIYKHALRNAMVPVITVVGLVFGSLLGGAVITESVFSWPGVGGFIIDSIRAKDLTVVQGGVLMLAMLAAGVNLLIDVVYAVIDPRIRAQYSR